MADEPIVVTLGKRRISILPTIKGMVLERKKVREAIARLKPDAIALPVSKEGLRGLRALHRGRKPELFLSHYEAIYARRLARYGKVMVPPPSYSEAYAVAARGKIPLKAIDMNEAKFAEVFCDNVSGSSLFYHSVRWRWLKHKRFGAAKTARQFVLAWDAAVNALKGFRNLENAREEHMARRLVSMSEKYRHVLAVLELERTEGVVRRLKTGKVKSLEERDDIGDLPEEEKGEADEKEESEEE